MDIVRASSNLAALILFILFSFFFQLAFYPSYHYFLILCPFLLFFGHYFVMMDQCYRNQVM